jgi:hypothetical protein
MNELLFFKFEVQVRVSRKLGSLTGWMDHGTEPEILITKSI